MQFKRILIIQTAFIGDVILATPVVEKLHKHYPEAKLDFLLRKGNETLLDNHPLINKVLIWEKSKNKYRSLLEILLYVRDQKYDLLVNLQRFATTGLMSAVSGAALKIGFKKNPFSFLYDEKIPHELLSNKHEVERNISLVSKFTDNTFIPPKLYPSSKDYNSVRKLKEASYLCIAPTSVWLTKQFPAEKWISFINKVSFKGYIYLLGAPGDHSSCEHIVEQANHPNVKNLAGKLSLLESAALMQDAVLNFVNDSAPLHIASAVNGKTCAVFCSTIPGFGFFPLADFSEVVQILEPLACRPCGLHGYMACPLKHFSCAHTINEYQLLEVLHGALKAEGYPSRLDN